MASTTRISKYQTHSHCTQINFHKSFNFSAFCVRRDEYDLHKDKINAKHYKTAYLNALMNCVCIYVLCSHEYIHHPIMVTP